MPKYNRSTFAPLKAFLYTSKCSLLQAVLKHVMLTVKMCLVISLQIQLFLWEWMNVHKKLKNWAV